MPASFADEWAARLPTCGPVRWDPALDGWSVTRHADALAVLRHPGFHPDDPAERLTRLRERGGPKLDNFRFVLSMVTFFVLPPQHTALRRFLSLIIQHLDLAGLRRDLHQRAALLLAAARAAGEIDLARGYGRDLALFTIHRLLGIPLADCTAIAGTVREVGPLFDRVTHPLRRLAAADEQIGALLEKFAVMIRQRRQRPEDDGLTLMTRLSDSTFGLSESQLAGLCAFLFIAGEETTASGLTSAAALLAEQPHLRARLASSPGLVTLAAREALRLTAPFQNVTRIATADIAIGGAPVRAGQSVTVMLSAANRDPAAYADPHAFDPERGGPDQLAFGYGMYRCLGAGFVALELEVALGALAGCGDLRLAPGPFTWEPRTRVPALAQARAFLGPPVAP